MKKVLIFGVDGFVGRYLVKEFENNNYEVYGSDKINSGSSIKYGRLYQADLLDVEQVNKVIEEVKPDIIINLAAISSVGVSWNIPQTTLSVNVIGALNIMESARKNCKDTKVMFIGSSEEYESVDGAISEKTSLNANNPYGISKMAQECFAEVYRDRYGMKIYCVRPFNHTGVGQNENFVLPSFCKQVADIEKSGNSGIIKVGNLTAERDFCDVRDIVRAYRMIIESEDCSCIYNVGSGKAYSLKKLLDSIISFSSQTIIVEIDSNRFRPIDTLKIYCNNELIRNNLGWEPKIHIIDTLKEMYEYYLNK